MNRIIFAIVIGALCCLAHFILGIKYIYDLTALNRFAYFREAGHIRTVLWISIIFCCIMIVASTLLIFGARKKRPSLIAPWLVLAVIGIISSTVEFCLYGYRQAGYMTVVFIISIIIISGLCYPIFTLWRDLRKGTFIEPTTTQQPQATELPNISARDPKQTRYSSVPQGEV